MNLDHPTLVRLREKGGDPAQFEAAVWDVLGEISITEAEAAIDLYKREWESKSQLDQGINDRG